MKRKSFGLKGRRPHRVGIKPRSTHLCRVLGKQLDIRYNKPIVLYDMNILKPVDSIPVKRMAGSCIGSLLNTCSLWAIMFKTPTVIGARTIKSVIWIPCQTRRKYRIICRRNAGELSRTLLHIHSIASAIGKPSCFFCPSRFPGCLGEIFRSRFQPISRGFQFGNVNLVCVDCRKF